MLSKDLTIGYPLYSVADKSLLKDPSVLPLALITHKSLAVCVGGGDGGGDVCVCVHVRMLRC
jgi:hypothetical protein